MWCGRGVTAKGICEGSVGCGIGADIGQGKNESARIRHLDDLVDVHLHQAYGGAELLRWEELAGVQLDRAAREGFYAACNCIRRCFLLMNI